MQLPGVGSVPQIAYEVILETLGNYQLKELGLAILPP